MMRVWATIFAFVLVVLLYGVVLLGWDRKPPIDYIGGGASHLEPAVLKAGEFITLHMAAYVNHPCGGTIYRDIVGNNGVIHPYAGHPIKGSLTPGRQEIEYTFQLPTSLPVGKATYRGKVVFSKDCSITSHFAPIVVTLPELEFEIIE